MTSAHRISRRTASRWTLPTAAVLGLATFLLLLFTQPQVGISRDESIYFDAALSYSGWIDDFTSQGFGALSDQTIERRFSQNREHPGLPKILFGLSHRLFHDALLWTRHATGFRLPALLFSGLLVFLIVLLGARELSLEAGVFAALAFLLTPRHFFHLQIACFDGPATATWLLTLLAYRYASDDETSWRRGLLAGLAFGFAIAIKHIAYFLPPLFVFYWLACGGLTRLRAAGWRRALGCLPRSFWGFAVIGPLVLYLSWPLLWHHPFRNFGWYLSFHTHHENYPWLYLGHLLREPPFPWAYPFVVTALTLPLPFLLLTVSGMGSSLTHLAQPLLDWGRARFAGVPISKPDRSPEDQQALAQRREHELFLLCFGLFPLLLIALPGVPIFGGVKHWMHGLPLLLMLGGEALALLMRGAARPSWRPVERWIAGLATLALLFSPAVLATVRSYPYGTHAYNALAGGTPGAASLGMERHFWSHAVTGVFPWINAHAPKGARIYFHELTYGSFHWYQADGRLRADLHYANDPADSELAAYQTMQEFRDREFEIWSDYGTRRPVTELAIDGVPMVIVYARPSLLPAMGLSN